MEQEVGGAQPAVSGILTQSTRECLGFTSAVRNSAFTVFVLFPYDVFQPMIAMPDQIVICEAAKTI